MNFLRKKNQFGSERTGVLSEKDWSFLRTGLKSLSGENIRRGDRKYVLIWIAYSFFTTSAGLLLAAFQT